MFRIKNHFATTKTTPHQLFELVVHRLLHAATEEPILNSYNRDDTLKCFQQLRNIQAMSHVKLVYKNTNTSTNKHI